MMRNTIVFVTAVLMVLGLSSSFVLAKEDIYRWVDKDGVVHFGNRADAAADAEAVEIKKSPDSVPADPQQSSDPANQTPSYAQQQREERAEKKKEMAQKKAELSKECDWHRQMVAQLEPHPRVIIEQEDGTVVRMDDNDRLKHLKTSKDFIAKNCD